MNSRIYANMLLYFTGLFIGLPLLNSAARRYILEFIFNYLIYSATPEIFNSAE
jgi:hypothetical protein